MENHRISIFHVEVLGMKLRCAEIDGIKLCNTAPHPLTFGDEFNVYGDIPTSGLAVTSTVKTSSVGEFGGASLQRPEFSGKPEYKAILKAIKELGIIAVGSIIATKAYPNLIFGVVPVKGFERVSTSEKRVYVNLFNVA